MPDNKIIDLDAARNRNQPTPSSLAERMDLMDMIEETLDAMVELGVTSREELEDLLARLERDSDDAE